MTDAEPVEGRTLTLAEHWLHVGRPDRCLELLRSGEPAGVTPRAFELRASALLALERPEEAAAEARAGLAADAGNPSLMGLLGLACRNLGDLEAGEQAFLSALRYDTENPWLLAQYAILLVMAGRVDKARRVVASAEQLDAEEEAVLRARAMIAHVEGRDADATAIAREAVARDPDNAGGLASAGAYAMVEGRVSQGAQHLRAAAALEPDPAIADMAREAKWLTHPLMAPMRLMERVGPARLWIGAIVVIFGLNALGLERPSVVVAGMYLLLVVYSWTVPPALRAWLRRRR